MASAAIYESGLAFIISTDSIWNVDHYHTPRINWDYTISPNLLNHWALGYLDWYTHQYELLHNSRIDRAKRSEGMRAVKMPRWNRIWILGSFVLL